MRVWVEDLKYHLAMALRAVGLGVVVVAWASALGSEAQQVSDVRYIAEVLAAVVFVLAIQLLTAAPPSASLTDLLKPMERDIVAVARERAGKDQSRLDDWTVVLRQLASQRISSGANVPRDRKRWLRTLSRLAEVDQSRDELQVHYASDRQPD